MTVGIKVSYKSKDDGFRSMKKRLENINGSAIEVGVLKGEHAWLASIHEYGMEIRPGRAQYLTVPLTPDAVGRRANSFPNTFVYTAKSGNKFIAQKSGNGLKLLYWLTKSVRIPERSFLRTGFDENKADVMKKAQMMLADVADGKMSEEEFYKAIGLELSSKIKGYASDLDNPANSSITSNNKGSSNPLFDTGDMIGSITWRKEGGAAQ